MATIQDFGYSPLQQLYCLNGAANAVGRRQDTQQRLQEEMQKALEDCIPKLNGSKGDWKVTWGPAVFKTDPEKTNTGPMNAWFVAKSEALNICCVAIAGTALHSLVAWEADIAIARVVDFDAWVSKWTPSGVPTPQPISGKLANPKKPFIAYGTSRFTYNIVNFKSPAGAASAGKALGEYLQADAAGYDVVFTGHSMGGAVSPTVALGLSQGSTLKHARSVKTLPSAGATPGNAVFRDRFVTKFPSGDDYNTDYYNILDVVPHGFSTDTSDDRNFAQVLKIYAEAQGTALTTLKFASGYIGGLIEVTMPYANLPGTQIQGPKVPIVKTNEELFDSLHVQHVIFYFQKLGVWDFYKLFEKTLDRYGLKEIEMDEDQDRMVSAFQAATEAAEKDVTAESPAEDETAA